MTNPILCLQNIPCETLGTFEALFLNDGFDIEKVNATTQRVPIDPTLYSAIVILGGPMSVYENSGFIKDQINLARISSKKEIPLLGICLGSQIVAQSSGGTVFKGPKKEALEMRIYFLGFKILDRWFFSGMEIPSPSLKRQEFWLAPNFTQRLLL
jgi:GMP synthase-like glutamine amidotransferase